MIIFNLIITLSWLIGHVLNQKCPEFYTTTPDGKYCLQMSNGAYTRNDSANLCAEQDAQLLKINDAFMNQFVLNMISQQRKEIWLGVKCTSSDYSYCKWDDGNLTYNGYYNFGYGMPNVNIGQCIYMNIEGSTAGQWYSQSCDLLQMNYMCMTSALSDPCDGYSTFGTACYKVFSNATTFTDADNQCQSHGGRLTSIHSKDENDFILGLLSGSSHLYAWIGLYSSSSSSTYWEDNSPYDYNNFGLTNYNLGSCVSMAIVDDIITAGQWINADCTNQKMPFVCKKGGIGTTMNYENVTTLAPFNCDHPYYFNSSNNYIYSPAYPESYNYGQSLKCEYIILSDSSNYKIKINFPRFFLDQNSYMAIYSSLSEPFPFQNITGTIDPNLSFYSNATSMKLIFTTSGQPTNYNNHWSILYTSTCCTGRKKTDIEH